MPMFEIDPNNLQNPDAVGGGAVVDAFSAITAGSICRTACGRRRRRPATGRRGWLVWADYEV
jgi:hypothetical protein